jgi:NADH-quinone oxidoreductase subunit L
MKAPLLVLAFFTLAGGALPIKEFVPLEHGFHGPFLVTILGLAAGTAGLLASLYFYAHESEWLSRLAERFAGPRTILKRKYYIDDFYNALIRYGQDGSARACDLFERHIVVNFAVNGTARLTAFAGHFVRQLQTGRIQFYAFVFSLGLTALAYGLLLWKR